MSKHSQSTMLVFAQDGKRSDKCYPKKIIKKCCFRGASGSWIIEAPNAPSAAFTPGSGSAVWVPTAGSAIPSGAFVGGEDNGEGLVVGRAQHEGALIPGKVVPSHGVCCKFVCPLLNHI